MNDNIVGPIGFSLTLASSPSDTKREIGIRPAMHALPIIASCDGCGACCRHMVAPPFIISRLRNEPAEKGVPADLLAELLPRWELRLFVAESACSWYDAATQKCRHYDLRPDACREFEINSPSCYASREKWSVSGSCGLMVEG